MLYKDTVKPETFVLLKRLMSLGILESYFLIGGTALALQLGHRISYDIDLLGKIKTDYKDLTEKLSEFGDLKMIYSEDQVFQCQINDIKIDIVNYKTLNLLKPLIKIDDIRMSSIEDIATMKIKTIEDRGYKRDFFDLYCLLRRFSLESILQFTEQKYPETNRLHVARCLVDFIDAEDQEEPNMLDPKVSWDEVKEYIKTEVKKITLV